MRKYFHKIKSILLIKLLPSTAYCLTNWTRIWDLTVFLESLTDGGHWAVASAIESAAPVMPMADLGWQGSLRKKAQAT